MACFRNASNLVSVSKDRGKRGACTIFSLLVLGIMFFLIARERTMFSGFVSDSFDANVSRFRVLAFSQESSASASWDLFALLSHW